MRIAHLKIIIAGSAVIVGAYYIWAFMSRTVIAGLPPPSTHSGKVEHLDDILRRKGIVPATPSSAFAFLEPQVRDDLSVLRTPNYQAQEKWRQSLGLPPRHRVDLQDAVEGRAAKFGELILDYSRIEYFLTRKDGVSTYFKTDGFDTTLVSMEASKEGEDHLYLKSSPLGSVVRCKIPVRLPAEFKSGSDGYLVVWYAEGIRPDKWTLIRVGLMSHDNQAALWVLPFLRN